MATCEHVCLQCLRATKPSCRGWLDGPLRLATPSLASPRPGLQRSAHWRIIAETAVDWNLKKSNPQFEQRRFIYGC